MYFYRIRCNSACTKSRRTGFWENRYQMIDKTLYNIRIQNCSEKRKKLLRQRLAHEYYVLLGQINDESDQMIRGKLLKDVKKYKELCHEEGVKNRMCSFLIKLTGFFMATKILHIYSSYSRNRKI